MFKIIFGVHSKSEASLGYMEHSHLKTSLFCIKLSSALRIFQILSAEITRSGLVCWPGHEIWTAPPPHRTTSPIFALSPPPTPPLSELLCCCLAFLTVPAISERDSSKLPTYSAISKGSVFWGHISKELPTDLSCSHKERPGWCRQRAEAAIGLCSSPLAPVPAST